MRSRSFSAPVSDLDGLLCAASVRMESAARVLRREGSEATHVGVLFSTSRFRENEPQHSAEAGERLLRPTADTIELTAVAEALVRRAWCSRDSCRPSTAQRDACSRSPSSTSPRTIRPVSGAEGS